jgi:hypothetical protein
MANVAYFTSRELCLLSSVALSVTHYHSVEKIAEEFDTMIVCRYPDSMKNFYFRESKKLIHVKPPTIAWGTGLHLRLSYPLLHLTMLPVEILHLPSRGLSQSAKFLIRVSPSPPGGVLMRKLTDDPVEPTNDSVDVAFTVSRSSSHLAPSCLIVSSSKLWAECSDMVRPLPPRLYGRLIATPSTVEMIEKRHQQIVDVFNSTRLSSRPPPPPVTDFSDYLHLSSSQSHSLSKHTAPLAVTLPVSQLAEPSIAAAAEEEKSSSAGVKNELPSPFDFPFCCERSWMSHSFMLPPGEYVLLVATEEQKTSSLTSSYQSPQEPQSSLNKQQKPRIPPPPRQVIPSSDSVATLFPENDQIEDGIWCQVSSVGRIGLHELSLTEMEEKLPLDHRVYFQEEMKMKARLPQPEVWPLMMDHQQEVSSKGLIQLMTQLRAEVNRVNIDLLELKSKDSSSSNSITKTNRAMAPPL